MRKSITYLGFLLFVLSSYARGQDYIITLENDTIYCLFPQNPRLRPKGEFHNGHIVITAEVNGREQVFRPTQLKGYNRSRHGRHYLCNGTFYSYQAEHHDRRYRVLKDYDTARYFMNSLVNGDKAHLLITYTFSGSTMMKSYYLKLPGRPRAIRIRNRKHLAALLNPADPASLLKNLRLKSNRKGFPEIVKLFNGEPDQGVQTN